GYIKDHSWPAYRPIVSTIETYQTPCKTATFGYLQILNVT
ncbi:unnamed protein product, partial [Rotaria sp. Silwood1]